MPTSCVEKDFLLLPEIHHINLSFILKFINSFFRLNMNFPFVQSSCFYNNSFLSLMETYFKNHFKRPKTILITRQRETELNNFFLWFLNSCNMIYDHVGAVRDPLKQDLALEFCWNQNKIITLLNETHINHHQIHHKKIIDWVPSFSSGDHTKWMLFVLFLCLEGITEVDTDPKGRSVSFKITPPNDRVLCLCLFRVGH